MQKDVDLIYGCIFEETYKDKMSLDIIISKVEDPRMAVGFLMDLALKHAMYEIDSQDLPSMIAEYIGESKPHDYMIGCHKIFVSEMRKKNDSEIRSSLFIEKALRLLVFERQSDFDSLLASTEKPLIERLKEELLEAEAYEYVSAVDKHL